MRIIVKLRYRLFQRSNGIFFIEDRVTSKQASLQTRDKVVAQRIFNAKNESHQQPAINLQIARAYLLAGVARSSAASSSSGGSKSGNPCARLIALY